MKIAYLILAHDNPRHLQRLVRVLSTPSSRIFVHLDKKSDLRDFAGMETENLSFCEERIAVYWGDFSQVEATLTLMRKARAEPNSLDRFVLLSGTDYPLHSASWIESFFERHRASEFIDLIPMPSEAAGKPISRLNRYKQRPDRPVILRMARRVLEYANVIPRDRDYRDYLSPLVPYGGSQWWALSAEACQMIQTFTEQEPQKVNFFKNTHCPDEMFFHTIVGNSSFRSRATHSLTYADWRAGGSRPESITKRHLDYFESASSFALDEKSGGTDMLFARKFSDDSWELVTRLDHLIAEKEGRRAD